MARRLPAAGRAGWPQSGSASTTRTAPAPNSTRRAHCRRCIDHQPSPDHRPSAKMARAIPWVWGRFLMTTSDGRMAQSNSALVNVGRVPRRLGTRRLNVRNHAMEQHDGGAAEWRPGTMQRPGRSSSKALERDRPPPSDEQHRHQLSERTAFLCQQCVDDRSTKAGPWVGFARSSTPVMRAES